MTTDKQPATGSPIDGFEELMAQLAEGIETAAKEELILKRAKEIKRRRFIDEMVRDIMDPSTSITLRVVMSDEDIDPVIRLDVPKTLPLQSVIRSALELEPGNACYLPIEIRTDSD